MRFKEELYTPGEPEPFNSGLKPLTQRNKTRCLARNASAAWREPQLLEYSAGQPFATISSLPLMNTLGKLLLALALLCLTAWGAVALLIAGPQDGQLSKALAAGMGLLALIAVSRL